MHYQIHHPQGKLVLGKQGAVFEFAVDLLRSSPKLGKWVGLELYADKKRQLWVTPGLAHGFVVTSESVELFYKTSEYWYREYVRSFFWCDPTVGIH